VLIKDTNKQYLTFSFFFFLEQIYNLFPPYFRDMWLRLKEVESENQSEQLKEETKSRDYFLNTLLEKIENKKQQPQQQQNKKTNQDNDTNEKEKKKKKLHNSADSWEDEDLSSSLDQSLGSSIDFEISDVSIIEESEFLNNQLQNVKLSSKWKEIHENQKKLPIYEKKEEIIELLNNNRVTIVSGETG